ncbi:hypothetical protein Q9Q99_05960 [Curtobacterium flaccumfaciens]|nr:hypothetical protein Q9Q99_05960 [Curtobacterium flaccumfaciens]
MSSWIPDISSLASTGRAWGLRNPVEEYSYIGIAAVVLIAAAVLIRPGRRDTASADGAAPTVDAAPATAPARDADAALVRRRQRGVVPIVASLLAFSVVLVFLGGPLLAAVRELPVFDSSPIGRARVVVGFFAAVLAGIGFGRVVEPETLRDELARFRRATPLRRAGRIAAVVLVVLFTASVGLQTALALDTVPADVLHRTKLLVLVTGVVGAGTAVLVLVPWLVRIRALRIAAAMGIVAAVCVPAVAATVRWWPIAPNSTFYPSSPAIDYLQEHVSAQDRFATAGTATLPGSASYYGIRSTTGHAFQTREWKQLMRTVDPTTYPTATYLTFAPDEMTDLVDSAVLDRVATKYVVADPSAPIAGTPEASARRTGWTDLTTRRPSVDGPSNSGPVNGVTLTGPPQLTTSARGMTLTVAIVADGTREDPRRDRELGARPRRPPQRRRRGVEHPVACAVARRDHRHRAVTAGRDRHGHRREGRPGHRPARRRPGRVGRAHRRRNDLPAQLGARPGAVGVRPAGARIDGQPARGTRRARALRRHRRPQHVHRPPGRPVG